MYKQIQHWVREQFQFVPETCWIAHVMSDFGLTKRIAPNRIRATARVNPCPDSKRAAIIVALTHFGLLPRQECKK
jgi:hypothetical protein